MLTALFVGILLAWSASPHNWWALAIIALAVLYALTEGRSFRRRATLGFAAFFVSFLFTLSWARQFNVFGYILLCAFQAGFFSLALASVPGQRSWQRALAFPAAVTTAELLRNYFPWGGFPMGGLTTGQANGPLVNSVAILGESGLVLLLSLGAVAVRELLRARRPQRKIVLPLLIPVIGLPLLGSLVTLPVTGTWNVATVQAGGPQALTRDQQNPNQVFNGHLAVAKEVDQPVDLMVLPENVLILRRQIEGSAQEEELSTLARQHRTRLVAGVVESEGSRFHNYAMGWNRNGTLSGSYEKVQRVPFGEFVPYRPFVEAIADLSQVPADAFVGTGPPIIEFENHKVGVAISYEGLFSRRLRLAANAGGEVLVVPTNASSYKSSKVAAAQLQAARMRALETGRWLVQASPTGQSAIVSPEGKLVRTSAIGPASVLEANISLHQGRTPYMIWGPLMLVGLILLCWAPSVAKIARFGSTARGDTLSSS